MDRRSLILGSAVGGALVASGASRPVQAAVRFGVTGLRTAQLTNPLGLNDPAPALSWQLEGGQRGLRQTAYRILVASDQAKLRAGQGDLWDSGRVASSCATGVAYAGRKLRSRQRAWWTVTVWDEQGHSAMGAPAFWEAPLAEADWTAAWIEVERDIDRADRLAGMPLAVAPTPPHGERRLFRLPFESPVGGQATLTFHTTGIPHALTLDGAPLALPSHARDAFGGPPAFRLQLAVTGGPHVLGVEIEGASGFIPEPTVGVAGQIRLPSQRGPASYVVAGWQTALAAPDGWRRPGPTSPVWSGAKVQEPSPHPPWPATPAMVLRRRFTSPQVARARLYVAALGAYEMRINGRKVGEDILQSETSDYRKTVLYRTYDVTDLIQPGENVLGAMAGDGWYASYTAPSGRYAFGPAPRRLIAQLEIEDAEGRLQRLGTDEAWRFAEAPVQISEIYDGETYDARLEQPGWDRPGFDDSAWTPCRSGVAPGGRLTAQAGPAIRALQTVKPVAVRSVGAGAVVDFGQNLSGVARLRVRGAAGAKVTLRFAEILAADGSVDQSNLRAARATDTYILRGDPAGETWQPRFTYHGFRYVQLDGLPSSWSVEAIVLGSDMPQTGVLTIDQPVIQRLWLNTLWSQKSNFFGVPTDCPQRDERLGWTGDAQVFWDAAAFNMDVGPFTRRFLSDLRDGQSAKGAFPIWAPAVSSPPGGSPGWSDAGVMLPWTCWRRYGDLSMAREHWPAMIAYVEGVMADNPDLIWRNVSGADFGDWLSLDAKNPADATTPKPLAATAMLKRSLDQVAELGEALGEAEASALYRQRAEATTKAFQAAFVAPDGQVGNGSQTGYILAIALGLLTLAQRRQAGVRLSADIRRRGTLLSTGFLGTPLSLDALDRIGETSLIYDLLLRTDFPSWGYMVKHGATTIWERWNGDSGDVAMNSYNHYALGAVVGFLYRRIAGIEPIEPGFAAFKVAPLLDPRVRSAGARYDSVQGRIETRWTITPDDRFALDLTVPPNTRAKVTLPALAKNSGFSGLTGLTTQLGPEATTLADVGAGRYRFVSKSRLAAI